LQNIIKELRLFLAENIKRAMISAMVIQDISQQLKLSHDSVVVIGNFDGVHKGHQYLIDEARKEADKRELELCVLTFDPHPRQFFSPESVSFQIAPLDERKKRLSDAGVDHVVVLPFNQGLANMKAHDFIEYILKENLKAQAVFVGEDFRFGYKRQGSIGDIKASGINAFSLAPHCDETGEIYSSTRVRQAIKHADMQLANSLLGWEWFIRGEVVHGDKRGRELGYPTANIWLEDTICPDYGIYAVEIKRQNKAETILHGAASIGIRPMFETRMPILEVFIFDFDEEIYGEILDVTPVKKIRDELKFDSLDELIVQMDHDCKEAKSILKAI
jgi:riboflavin kinase/FMN adenylyltransferase